MQRWCKKEGNNRGGSRWEVITAIIVPPTFGYLGGGGGGGGYCVMLRNMCAHFGAEPAIAQMFHGPFQMLSF